MKKHKISNHLEFNFFRWISFFIGLGIAFSLLIAFFYLVTTRNFTSAGAVLLAVAATYISLAALLYARHTALPAGPSKVRSMYAAERMMQAITFTLLGGLLATSLFVGGLYFESGLKMDSTEPQLWLFLFFLPLLLVLWGYVGFFESLKIICREFGHPLSAREIARRIRFKR